MKTFTRFALSFIVALAFLWGAMYTNASVARDIDKLGNPINTWYKAKHEYVMICGNIKKYEAMAYALIESRAPDKITREKADRRMEFLFQSGSCALLPQDIRIKIGEIAKRYSDKGIVHWVDLYVAGRKTLTVVTQVKLLTPVVGI